MKYLNFIIFSLILILGNSLFNANAIENQEIYNYVNTPDPHFKWTLNATYDLDGWATYYVLEMYSQQWMTINQSNTPIWKHWLEVCIPNNRSLSSDSSILLIQGGNIQDWHVETMNETSRMGKMICASSGEVTSTILQVPNESIIFENDGIWREEDDIVAYTWHKFIDTNEPIWINLNPQTKAAVKAMDAITEFGLSLAGTPDYFNSSKFFVTGGSKRGWTTYFTGIVDPRVIGIAPMVIPILNVVENIAIQIPAYGNWSFALIDYINNNIPQFLYTSYFQVLSNIIDPINYIDSLEKLPKYILIGTSDEFFLPDSTKFFFSKLTGEKKLSIFDNTTHGGIQKQEVADCIANYYHTILNGIETIPQIDWQISYSNDSLIGTIELKIIQGTPIEIRVWSGITVTNQRRDFRMYTCKNPNCFQDIQWGYITLSTSTSSNYYMYQMEKPSNGGWVGFYFQIIFDQGSSFTTEMAVVPDIYPFPVCSEEMCGSGLPRNATSSSSISSSDE